MRLIEKQAKNLNVGDVIYPSGLVVTFVGEGTRPNHTSVKVHNPRSRSRAASQWRSAEWVAVFERSN